MQPYLSEYDFSVARSCPTKLYYRKKDYPTLNAISSYDRCLTDSSFTFYVLGMALFPTGIRVACGMDLEKGITITREALQQSEVTLFEPLLYGGYKVARPSILVKKEEQYQLIRIAARTVDASETFRSKKDQKIQSVWLPLLQSVAFQTYVLQEMLPGVAVTSHLLMADRQYRAPCDDLHKGFRIAPTSQGEILSRLSGITMDFTGDQHLLACLRMIDVSAEVAEVLARIAPEIDFFAAHLQSQGGKIVTPIDKHCKHCEFRGSATDDRDGFRECWGPLAQVTPHIFDLYHGTRLVSGDHSLVRQLVLAERASLLDVPWESIEDTVHGYRQRIQILCTRERREWISDRLLEMLDRVVYPLHFIDFETARLAIPPKAGFPPYVQIAFQWSCHRILSPGALPQHYSWLNVTDSYPNEAFAKTLQECLGDQGTVFTWGMHENSVLKDIYYQLRHGGSEALDLLEWLGQRVRTPHHSRAPFVDMHALTLKYYFHPLMKGRTSLKCVLPAIWQTSSHLHNLPWLQEYYLCTEEGIQNPYHTLGKYRVSDREWVIQEGMEAALAYQEILYGADGNNPNWRFLLEQYCCLDTMAMVIVWLHWQHLGRIA